MNTSFLQSPLWADFQSKVGRRTVALAGDNFQGLGILHHLPVGDYLYFPRGPVISGVTNSELGITNFAKELEKLAKEKNVRWIRIEPSSEEELKLYRETFGEKLVKAPHDVQPREILAMGITPEEEALLSRMKPKTRYNIRLAEKKGVRVVMSREEKYQQAFLRLMTATATRKEITPHPREHYQHFFSLPEDKLFLFVAEYEGKVLAANVVILFGDTATYLHGGSSDEHREVMAPYLLQWEQIRFAKSRGMKYYDFGGMNTRDDKSPWRGITRFKQGFTPDTPTTLFPGTHDIVLSRSRYFLYTLMSRVKASLVFLRKKFL